MMSNYRWKLIDISYVVSRSLSNEVTDIKYQLKRYVGNTKCKLASLGVIKTIKDLCDPISQSTHEVHNIYLH